MGYGMPTAITADDIGGRVIFGFTATRISDGAVAMALRGTEGWKEWLKEDFRFWMDSLPWGTGWTDVGFTNLFSSLRFPDGSKVGGFSAIAGLKSICGHSLGAAAARLLAIRLGVQDLVTFGEPMIGDDQFAAWAAGATTNARRYRMAGDPIPDLPPAIVGYRPVGIPTFLAVPAGFGRLPEDRHNLATYAAALTI